VGESQGRPKQNNRTGLVHPAKRYRYAVEQSGYTEQELHGHRTNYRATQNLVPTAPCSDAKRNYRSKSQGGDPTVMELR